MLAILNSMITFAGLPWRELWKRLHLEFWNSLSSAHLKPARVPSPTLFSTKFRLTSPIYKISIMRSENVNLYCDYFHFGVSFQYQILFPDLAQIWTHICIDYWQSNELGNRKTHWYIVHTVLSDHQQDQISLICFTI